MNLEEKENWEYLHIKMRDEGFHYCFINYSDWREIEDDHFHQLRKQYIELSKKITLYVEQKLNEELEDEGDF